MQLVRTDVIEHESMMAKVESLHCTTCILTHMSDCVRPPAGYPLLDNILAPTAAGVSSISSTFGGAASCSFTLTVKDTYQPGWPAAAALSDTSARVDANMSDTQLLVTYLMVPSAQLDLAANPPVMPGLAAVQAGGAYQPVSTKAFTSPETVLVAVVVPPYSGMHSAAVHWPYRVQSRCW